MGEFGIRSGEPEARISLCKCKEAIGKTYGVRFQRSENNWKYTWAFKIAESSAKREGYDNTEIFGNIYPDAEYPGCPWCGAKAFVICGRCHHLNCNVSAGGSFKCEWCGMRGELTGFDGDGIASGGDIG